MNTGCQFTCSILTASPVPISLNWVNHISGNIVAGTTDCTRRDVAFLFVATAYLLYGWRNRRVHNQGHNTSTTESIGAIKMKLLY